MARKINTARAYKLARSIILGLSLLSLLGAIYLTKTYGRYQAEYLNAYTDCSARFKVGNNDNPSLVQAIIQEKLVMCTVWLQMQNQLASTILFGYLIGLGLPILFFGSTALFNYITTEDKKK